MHGILPHIVTTDEKLVKQLTSEGYSIGANAGYFIVSKEIEIPHHLSRESVDALTEELRKEYMHLSQLEEGTHTAHVLVRKDARARLLDSHPTGYLVEMTDEGPIVHFIEHMTTFPALAGYGSLLDPAEMATIGEPGDIRRKLKYPEKLAIAEKKQIRDKVGYGMILDTQLLFNRGPSIKRYGSSQEQRNMSATLNSRPCKGSAAHVVIFNPADIADDPLEYLANETYGEYEYNRRRISNEDITSMGGKDQTGGNDIWILESPLITDEDVQLKVLTIPTYAQISPTYIDKITRGLVQAEKIAPGIALGYAGSTIQPNKKPLIEHQEFMQTLKQRLYHQTD